MNSCPLEETLPLPCIVLDVMIIGPETRKSRRKPQKCSSAKPRGPSPPQGPPALPSIGIVWGFCEADFEPKEITDDGCK